VGLVPGIEMCVLGMAVFCEKKKAENEQMIK
jgi:hypothetical protein